MTTNCRASWTDPLGRHRCCLRAGHPGTHVRTRREPVMPKPKDDRPPPLTYSQYVAAQRKAGAR